MKEYITGEFEFQILELLDEIKVKKTMAKMAE